MLLTPLGRLGWDSFTEMRRMHNEMNRLFAEFEGRTAPAVYPPVTFWVGDASVVVTAELPGIAESDLELSVRDDTLTIQGRREPEPEGENVAWHRRERTYGSFSRAVELPFRVDPRHGRGRCSGPAPTSTRPRIRSCCWRRCQASHRTTSTSRWSAGC